MQSWGITWTSASAKCECSQKIFQCASSLQRETTFKAWNISKKEILYNSHITAQQRGQRDREGKSGAFFKHLILFFQHIIFSFFFVQACKVLLKQTHTWKSPVCVFVAFFFSLLYKLCVCVCVCVCCHRHTHGYTRTHSNMQERKHALSYSHRIKCTHSQTHTHRHTCSQVGFGSTQSSFALCVSQCCVENDRQRQWRIRKENFSPQRFRKSWAPLEPLHSRTYTVPVERTEWKAKVSHLQNNFLFVTHLQEKNKWVPLFKLKTYSHILNLTLPANVGKSCSASVQYKFNHPCKDNSMQQLTT